MHPDSGWALQPLADMSTAEFDNWCQLLEERSGIVWRHDRKAYLEVRLTARMRELGISNYDGYYRQVLQGARGALEWSCLLDRLTVQETRFFRHQPSFDHVAEYLQQRLAAGQENLSLWSVGCATGEEAWSLAMTAAEVVGTCGGTAGFSVLATDISRTALATARDGCYSARSVAGVCGALREHYLLADGNGGVRVCEALARRACFSRINILELAQTPVIGMDVIFCQNVLIYFRRWQRRSILNQLAARLLPGGMLILGVGEITGWTHPQLVAVDNDKILAFVRKG
ncbi:CheR family methyltransferase [Thiopseudomonas denitrificans]|uniref:protein-glutamate O-methyltransferase n=1 Tax=Thiopseudomonas denitrificans TaxID=1501432 RepID=A0A4R6U1E9_9GAMM|nr:CheR family methyltransferase [Thiopseudomonas denitrificans]TDQ38125.1 type IV pilus assembly protein PilK [Thiopseudomonas denitrificans]